MKASIINYIFLRVYRVLYKNEMISNNESQRWQKIRQIFYTVSEFIVDTIFLLLLCIRESTIGRSLFFLLHFYVHLYFYAYIQNSIKIL